MSSTLGLDAERLAAEWLQSQGFEILERQLACRFGELDLVARKADVLAIVEVKYRSGGFQSAVASVTHAKQRRLSLAARWLFSQKPKWQSLQWRFDVVIVIGELARPQIQHLPAAFELQA